MITEVNFKPKMDIDEYLNNDLNIEIASELQEGNNYEGFFEPLEFFNFLHLQFAIVKENLNAPDAVRKHLFGLGLEEQKLFLFLHYLIRLIQNHINRNKYASNQFKYCLKVLLNEYAKLESKLFPKLENEDVIALDNKFNFNEVKIHIDLLLSTKDKIIYLFSKKTECLQTLSDADTEKKKIKREFIKKCDLEIEMLKNILLLEENKTNAEPMQQLKLSNKTGAKIDLIRVLNALSELHLIDKIDGQTPTKKEFFNAFGNFLGIDLSKYHSNLSQSLKNQPLEVNLKIFEDMIEIAKRNHYEEKR